MSKQDAFKNKNIESIEILVFSLAGIKFGIDVEQINEITKLDQVDRDKVKLSYFHEKIPFDWEKEKYQFPSLITLRKKQSADGIVINRPEDILSVDINSIRPLPTLLESGNKVAALWGIALPNNDIILLIDCYRF